MEGNYCGCGTWYEASVLEVIPKADADTIYYIKYTVDGEEETVSGDNIRRVSAKSMDSICSGTSTGAEDGVTVMTAPLPAAAGVEEVECDALGDLSLEEKEQCEAYTPKLSIGDDGAFVPELYEGTDWSSFF